MKFRHAVRKCKHIWKNQFVYIKYCLKEIDLRPGLPLTSQQSSYYTYSSLGYYTIFTIRLHSAHILLDAIYSRSYARGSHSRDYVKLSCLLCFLSPPQCIHNKNNHTCQIHRERSFVSQTKCLSGLFTAYGQFHREEAVNLYSQFDFLYLQGSLCFFLVAMPWDNATLLDNFYTFHRCWILSYATFGTWFLARLD